ncbi:MAG: hypothetical protein ACRD5F_06385 [Candidatus Acidiferrales bacterium]
MDIEHHFRAGAGPGGDTGVGATERDVFARQISNPQVVGSHTVLVGFHDVGGIEHHAGVDRVGSLHAGHGLAEGDEVVSGGPGVELHHDVAGSQVAAA